MEKYLKRLCNAIIAGKFNEEKYRAGRKWHGKFIQTEPLFCSYGTIGFTANVFDGYKNICTVSWDGELKELLIDDEPYKEYINSIVLEDYDICCNGKEISYYTDAGGDMTFELEKITRSEFQKYIDNFDIDQEIMLWWAETTEKQRKERGLPFDNIKEHYEDLESWKNFMQGVCYKLPY